jgi:class 3 adenylate cyclase/predicted ATPase
MDEVGEWLESIGLGQYAGAFAENDFDWVLLPELDHELLKDIGVKSAGHRVRILKAASLLSSGEAPVIAPAVPASKAPRDGEAERRQLTVMFCDLVDSTALSASLDPEAYRELLVAYQDAARGAIEPYDGFIARYMGDGLLVYFGYPAAHEDDAERAVRSGLELVEVVSRIGFHAEKALSVRIGIATGEVVAGDIVGKGAAEERAVLGETPNLAARLQGIATPDSVLIAESTRRLVEGRFELRALGVQSLRGLPAPVPAYCAVAVRTAASRFDASRVGELAPLIGRESELSLLTQRWERACEREGQVILLQGEPGIGKSRLLKAMRDQVRDTTATLQRYQCSPYHSGTAFHPIIDLLERAARFATNDSTETRLDKLEALLGSTQSDTGETIALLAALLSLPTERYPPLKMAPQKQRAETIEALVTTLGLVAAQGPLLIIFEDVHWSDPSTLEFLDTLIERAQSLPLLMLVSFRPEFTPPWMAYGHVTICSLNRLGRREVGRLAEEVTGGRALPTAVLDQIIDRTDGVPLFVEELTKTVLEAGVLHEVGEGYGLDGRLPDLAIPATLQDSLLSRLDRLGNAKEIAQVGACIGREFSYKLISAVWEAPEHELDQGLQRLVAHELVFARGQPPEASYVFKHALVQDAARRSLLHSRRRRVHAMIAETLEALAPDVRTTQPELLALHFTEAREYERAISYWRNAGQRATQGFANLEAIEHLQRGLDVTEELPESRDRSTHELVFQSLLAPIFSIVKGWSGSETEAAYRRARDLAEQLGNNEMLFVSLRGLFYVSYIRLDFSVALQLGRELVSLADKMKEPRFQVYARHSLAVSLMMKGDPIAARDQLERGIAYYDREAHADSAYRFGHDAGVMSLVYSALTWWITGHPDTAKQRAEEAMKLAEALAHPYTLAIGAALVAIAHQFSGDMLATRKRAELAVDIASESELSLPLLIGSTMAGWASAAEGQLDEGIERMQQSIDSWRTLGAGVFVPYFLGLLAGAHANGGDVERGLEIVEDGIETAEQSGGLFWESELNRLKGELLLQRRTDCDRSRAEKCFQYALRVARDQQAKSLELRAAMSLAKLQLQTGRTQEALATLTPVYEGFDEGFDTVDLKSAKALLASVS